MKVMPCDLTLPAVYLPFALPCMYLNCLERRPLPCMLLKLRLSADSNPSLSAIVSIIYSFCDPLGVSECNPNNLPVILPHAPPPQKGDKQNSTAPTQAWSKGVLKGD